MKRNNYYLNKYIILSCLGCGIFLACGVQREPTPFMEGLESRMTSQVHANKNVTPLPTATPTATMAATKGATPTVTPTPR